ARRARSRRRLRPRPARALSELAGFCRRRRRSRRSGARRPQGSRRGRGSRRGHRGGALALRTRRIRRRGRDQLPPPTAFSGSRRRIAFRGRADLRNLRPGQRALWPTEQPGVPAAARRAAPQPGTLGRGCVRTGAGFRAEAGGDSACLRRAGGRIPVVAGTGGNSTAEAIELTQSAKNAGADACLLVVPYYNKPTQEGLYRHFRTVAEKVDIPQIVYNVPGRTVADLAGETTLRLAQIPNIIGIKDATASIERGSDLLRR